MIFNTTGGGTALNFRVVGGSTAPANPTDNCIWINTDTSISSWVFSATKPSPAEYGMVWIATGTASGVAFNALKKNGIQVYPIAAKQYVGGAWVDVTAKSYQGGAWVEWWDGTLYSAGDEYISVTGGYEVVGSAVLTKNADSMYISSNAGGVYTVNKVDLSGYSKVVIEWTANSDNMDTRFVLSKTKESGYVNAAVVQTYSSARNGTKYTTELVVSSSGEYYIGFGRFATGNTSQFTVHKIYAVR